MRENELLNVKLAGQAVQPVADDALGEPILERLERVP